jgi:hypothetical protein
VNGRDHFSAFLAGGERFGRSPFGSCFFGGVLSIRFNTSSRFLSASEFVMAEPYKSPLSLPNEHMRMVGIISAHWELLEMMMQRAISEVMELEWNRVGVVVSQVGYRSKVDLLMAYARPLETQEPALWKEFTAVVEGLNRAYGLRNKYVHAVWRLTEDPIELRTFRIAGGRFKISDDPAPVEDMNLAAQQIFDAAEAFLRFFRKFGLMRAS